MGHIVLIERNEDFGSLCAALLTHAGHHVELLLTPEALRSFTDPAVDLLLMSEDEDWREIQTVLFNLAPQAKLLLMTGGIVGGARPPGFVSPDYPGCHVLPKPFGYAELRGAVERTLETRITVCPSSSG